MDGRISSWQSAATCFYAGLLSVIVALNCRHLMLVSTMDGYLTAIDAATGVEEWSVSTGLSLVSSSISKFEV